MRDMNALENGDITDKIYNRFRLTRSALAAGFLRSDGKADITSYSRHLTEQTMKNTGFADVHGSVDHTAYNLYRLSRTAAGAGFVNADGTVDIKGYQKYAFEKMVRKAGHVNTDGTIDAKAYRKAASQRAAYKAGFALADGSANVTGHRRHRAMTFQLVQENKARSAAARGLLAIGTPDMAPRKVTKPRPFTWPANTTVSNKAPAQAEGIGNIAASTVALSPAKLAIGESAEQA